MLPKLLYSHDPGESALAFRVEHLKRPKIDWKKRSGIVDLTLLPDLTLTKLRRDSGRQWNENNYDYRCLWP